MFAEIKKVVVTDFAGEQVFSFGRFKYVSILSCHLKRKKALFYKYQIRECELL